MFWFLKKDCSLLATISPASGVYLGQTISVTCEAFSESTTMVWRQLTPVVQTITNTGRYSIVTNTITANYYQQTLTISSTQLSDFGTYQCQATSSATFTLNQCKLFLSDPFFFVWISNGSQNEIEFDFLLI